VIFLPGAPALVARPHRFLHAFAKSQKANLTKSELAAYQQAAQALAKLTDEQLSAASATQGWKALDT
jgi:hypothetical protein